MINNQCSSGTCFDVQGTICEFIVSEDHDDEYGVKLWHNLVSVASGNNVATLAWSPYSSPGDAEVQQLIDLGLPQGLRWQHSHPDARFNFDSDSLALYLSNETIHASHGKLVLVTNK